MALSCLTLYAIAFSCVTLLGRSDSTTAVQMDMTVRQNDRRGSKVYFQNQVKTNTSIEVEDNSKTDGKEGPKVLQSSFLPSNVSKRENLTDEAIRRLNGSHSYFAQFDPINNKTKYSLDATHFDGLNNRGLRMKGGKRNKNKDRKQEQGRNSHKGKNIPNFIVWDILQDSEKEVRIHYNGITAKETVVMTGVDEDTGKRLGLKLRQLTDGTHFIQLIYNFDNEIQDCEYIRQKAAIQKFLSTFKDNVEKAKLTFEIEKEEEKGQEGNDWEDDEDDEYMEEDEGKIEKFSLDEELEQYEGEDEDFSTEYRNVTFQIINKEEDLPKDLAEWMNFRKLKKKCRENHEVLRQLVYYKDHGNEIAKKLAEEHLERVKRGLDFSLIFPGTKWCGKSHVAEKYTELGGFSKTDKCCRTHDHCLPLISAFERKYGFYNFRPYTISHCRCDLRRKRDIMDVFLVPGTKWCGKGRRATKYTSLGGFSRTDKCCRVHDTMCPHWIGSLENKYGLFNWRINTIMHCRCDKRFRACLKMAKTGTANFVGKLFFNVVQTKCFVLKPREECAKYSWWGTCEKKEYRKRAYLKDNLSY